MRPNVRTASAGALVSLLVFGAACSRRVPESRITSVEARIDGITCPTCVPPLEASLRRQYHKSAIEVDDDKDMATVRFADHESFSASEFRAAVERVRMRVVTIRVQACGKVEASNGDKWLTAGSSRFLVRSDRELPLNEPLCVDGTLDTRADPAVFHVSAFSVQSASGS
ncbi:MAG: hypothetical protein DMF86_20585 [Acidobacteria bacterium]|nr:MAG: hypothetical protein DMF86_20585 [Acidobacteriota bacterium]